MNSPYTTAAQTAPTAWRAFGASVEGTSHVKSGTGCQDSHYVARLTGGGLVIAVADGAGSAPLATLGSAIASVWAAEVAAQLAEEGQHDWTEVLTVAFVSARKRLRTVANTWRAPLDDLATTLGLVVVTGDVVAAGQVGDGLIVLGDNGGGFRLAVASDRGEYINETTFLTSPTWQADMRSAVHPADPITAVAVLSDGLALLAADLATTAPHPPFFSPLFAFASEPDAKRDELERFLASDRVNERTDDDKTLVVAVRV